MTQARSRSPLKLYQNDLIQPTLAEDLLKSSTYWPSETEACRVCLKSLFETLKNQSFFLRDLERAVSSKVSIAEFHASLATKADFLDLSSKIAELQTLIDKKASVNDVELSISLNKPALETFQIFLEKIEAEVKQKVGIQEFSQNNDRVSSKLAVLAKNLRENDEKIAELDSCKDKIEDLETLIKEFHAKIQNIHKNKTEGVKKLEMQELLKRIGDIEKKLPLKLENEDSLKFSFGSNLDFSADKKKISELFESKVDLKVFQEESSNLKSFVQSTLTEMLKRVQSQLRCKSPTEGLPKDFSLLKQEISQKFQKIDEKLEMLWKSKPDKSEIRSTLHEINSKLHEKLLVLSKTLSKDLKTPETSIFPQNENISDLFSEKFEQIQKDLLLKASVKDLCTLLDMKANVEEVNVALVEIHNELDYRNSVFPQGIWSFYNKDSGGVVFKQLKQSAELQVSLQDDVTFLIEKSGFFALEVLVFSEESNCLAVLKNGKRFLNCKERKNAATGRRVLEYVELLNGDSLELVLSQSPDIRGNFAIWEIVI